MSKRTAFFVSDRTGITAEMLGHSLLTQFDRVEFNEITLPFVDHVEKARRSGQANQRRRVRPTACGRSCSARWSNQEIALIIGDGRCAVPRLLRDFHLAAREGARRQVSHAIGRSHSAIGLRNYHHRIEAVNFSLSHDDGVIDARSDRRRRHPGRRFALRQDADVPVPGDAVRHPRGQLSADSRGLQQHAAADASCRALRDKLFGLTILPDRLQQIRSERRPGSQYATLPTANTKCARRRH